MGRNNKSKSDVGFIHRPRTQSEFNQLHRRLTSQRYVAIDLLKPGKVRDISLALGDAAAAGAQDMAVSMNAGIWCNGPLSKVAWSFDGRTDTVEHVKDKDGNDLGDYVKWGAGDNIPSVIPPLAMSSPYTGAPLRYIADLITGLGARLMYRFPDGELVEYRDAGARLQKEIDELEKNEPDTDPVEKQLLDDGLVAVGREPARNESPALKRAREALEKWENSWYGFDVKSDDDITYVPGAKLFLEENNLDLHMSQCMQDNVMLDIYFPTVGLQRGRARRWDYPVKPRITRVDMLPAYSCRLGTMDSNRYIHDVFFSDSLRTKGSTGATTTTPGDATKDKSFKRYPCAMPQHMLSEIQYIVESNLKKRIKERPTWIVCPTFYPSLNKPFYPQPAWWSVFTSKAFDFSATVLYDKYKQRDNNTTFSRCYYVSLDYLDRVFADEGYQGNPDKQQEFIEQLDQSMESFLQHRENNGKAMRQWMWTDPDGKEHKNIEVVDFKDTTNDAVKAGKEELELSTSPIFLALQVDPRLVGVPMAAASNGGTALREMHLLKQQQLSVQKRSYERFLNVIATYNEWERAEFHVIDQTLTTLDNSKTGTVETISGKEV